MERHFFLNAQGYFHLKLNVIHQVAIFSQKLSEHSKVYFGSQIGTLTMGLLSAFPECFKVLIEANLKSNELVWTFSLFPLRHKAKIQSLIYLENIYINKVTCNIYSVCVLK